MIERYFVAKVYAVLWIGCQGCLSCGKCARGNGLYGNHIISSWEIDPIGGKVKWQSLVQSHLKGILEASIALMYIVSAHCSGHSLEFTSSLSA